MNQIEPWRIWIGHVGDGRRVSGLFDASITAVVQLAREEPPIPLPRDLISYRFPLLDGAGNDQVILRCAIESVANLIKSDLSTLVCCSAGMSRSPAITAGAIAMLKHVDIVEALAILAQYRPVDVSPALVQDLRMILLSMQSSL